MRTVFFLCIAVVIPFSALAEPVDYARQVKPLLAARCYTCHGALKQQASLRLDTAASIAKGGDSGAAVSAGKSGQSVLIQRVTTADIDQRMPPEGEGSALTAEEVALLKAWIDQGASGPADEKPEPDPREHWAFRAPVRPALPVLKDSSGLRREARGNANPIDVFIAAEYEQRGLKPQPPAEKLILLRRVYLDLIGLPPTDEEMAAFAADTSDDAYEKVVNRLLDSPQYGERWGRHWMDIWRYSDWWGLGAEVRNSQKHIWHWRDWIVESLNDDVGYDEMVRQMIAADELYPTDLAKLRASGYLARQYFKFNRNSWMEETIEHTSKAFLGMTINCARCHDHKYDPIAQRDYYRFRAFFEPYQIRTEQVAGESDYEKDGVPLAFDCNFAAPTYLFRRGDDKRPVTDEPLTPGLPPLLSFEDLKIEPVTLPAEAHQPGLRPWVEENYLKLAEREIATAQATLEAARKTLADAESKSPAPTEPVAEAKPLVKDDFAAEKPDLWKAEAGEWKYADGKLVQKSDGDIRGVLALQTAPVDFVARFKYTPIGGKMWKSVGLSFDLVGENDALVYLSCVEGGSKLQVSYKQSGGNYAYPNEGTQPRPLKLGDAQDVVVRVRGPLINVQVNGEHALAYRLPIERKPGKLALITYDAVAEFHLFELSPLPADYALKVPTGGKPEGPVNIEQAKAALALAEKTLAAQLLGPNLVRVRMAADRAKLAMPPAENAAEMIRIAATAERQADLAKAEVTLAQRELDLLKADPAKKAEAEKNLTAAREGLEKAKAAINNPGEAYTSLPGALKTAESNLETPESMRKPFPTTSTGRRAALARWMTDRRHPTAARVAVNHIWLRHMGAPLVPTVFDFGRKGTPPTHPQLLDWLAVELMENNWSMKHLHRLIVTSQTYRLTSSARGGEANLKNDAENRCYWRMNPTRMESETLRDSLLHLAGELDLARGGPSVPLPATDSSKRRSLYFVHSHNEHSNLLSMFDDANVLDCYRRDQSIVPQQALALSNSKLSLEAAGKIAGGVGFRPAVDKAAVDDTTFIRRAFVLLLASEPSEEEQKACLEALANWQKQGIAVDRARANLVQSLLNHNDFITVR
jgi:hypothetical protein